jgi:hypothetical protein
MHAMSFSASGLVCPCPSVHEENVWFPQPAQMFGSEQSIELTQERSVKQVVTSARQFLQAQRW